MYKRVSFYQNEYLETTTDLTENRRKAIIKVIEKAKKDINTLASFNYFSNIRVVKKERDKNCNFIVSSFVKTNLTELILYNLDILKEEISGNCVFYKSKDNKNIFNIKREKTPTLYGLEKLNFDNKLYRLSCNINYYFLQSINAVDWVNRSNKWKANNSIFSSLLKEGNNNAIKFADLFYGVFMSKFIDELSEVVTYPLSIRAKGSARDNKNFLKRVREAREFIKANNSF